MLGPMPVTVRSPSAGGEGGERVDPGDGELAGLVAAEAGHPAEVVVVLAPALAGLVPAAHAAVADGQRVGDRLVGQRGEEAGPHGAVVGGHLGGADRGPLLAAEDHVHVLGLGALEAGDLLGVEAELQDGRRLHLAGQLGVLGLVAPGPEVAGAIDLAEEVGVAPPQHVVPLVEEGGLEDDVGACLAWLRAVSASRWRRASRRSVPAAGSAISTTWRPSALSVLEVAGLVLEATGGAGRPARDRRARAWRGRPCSPARRAR